MSKLYQFNMILLNKY